MGRVVPPQYENGLKGGFAPQAILYLVPGVGHCGGGEGNPNIASRPVYPYPALAKDTGLGDWHDGANYTQGAPLYTASSRTWAGSSFHTPYTPTTQGIAAP
ncbi:hypothetical protein [Paraburkholderia sp. 31.1]|uniref:hypothetical protein n=1 Tax=Paraburkholderia sp. 31.1 TaxID=2615205 RepID=UPI00223C256F|nr:hypothetical protein [Paraburkholderia sp. 31.1]